MKRRVPWKYSIKVCKWDIEDKTHMLVFISWHRLSAHIGIGLFHTFICQLLTICWHKAIKWYTSTVKHASSVGFPKMFIVCRNSNSLSDILLNYNQTDLHIRTSEAFPPRSLSCNFIVKCICFGRHFVEAAIRVLYLTWRKYKGYFLPWIPIYTSTLWTTPALFWNLVLPLLYSQERETTFTLAILIPTTMSDLLP